MLKGGRDLCFHFYEIPGRTLQAHSDNEYVAPRYSTAIISFQDMLREEGKKSIENKFALELNV